MNHETPYTPPPRRAPAAASPAQSALDTLAFAEKMVRAVKKRRAAQLAAGEITRARHDADVAAALDLRKLAKAAVIRAMPLN